MVGDESDVRIALNKTKLKQSSATSALMAGFALVAFIELDLPQKSGQNFTEEDHFVVIIFGLLTSLTVFVHLLALMIATCILPYVDSAQREAERLREDARQLTSQHSVTSRKHSAHAGANHDRRTTLQMRQQKLSHSQNVYGGYVQAAWILSTGIGITMFAVDLPFIAFIKVRCL